MRPVTKPFSFVPTCLLAAVLPGLLTGCASRNQGQPDFRIAIDAEDLGSAEKFVKDPDDPIVESQNLQITLDTAFIADFSEFGIRGEVAIIVNVKEFESDAKIDFSSGGQRSGRLVYFSDDVRKHSGSGNGTVAPRNGNFLNFTSMPVYGPVKYKGRPLLVEVSVIEFDEAEVNRAKAVLQKLAALGSKAYPPASPALAVLNQIGEAFLSGEQDDSELRFHTVLYPFTGPDASTHNFLRSGDLILVKEENSRFFGNVASSDGPIPWKKLIFDRNTKRLRLKESEEEYRNQSYFVFNITTKSGISDLNTQNEGQQLKDQYEAIKTSGDANALQKLDNLLDTFNKNADIAAEVNAARDAIARIRTGEFGTFGVDSTFRAVVQPLHAQINANNEHRTWSQTQIRLAMNELKSALAEAGHEAQAEKVSDDLFKKSVDEILAALKPA